MSKNRTGLSSILLSYSEIFAIVGDIVRVKVPEEESGNGISPCLEDLAVLEAVDGNLSLAQVIGIKRDVVALQVFNGTRGISTNSIVRFLGHPMQASYSGNIFGRVFRGTGEPIDGGPDLPNDPKVTIGGPSVNPMRRVLASKMIRTNVPMIDVFNCLVESQKIPIFSVSGEPFNQLFDKNVAPGWADRVLAMLELLRRGNDVAQMMQVTGEEGVSLEDHLVHQKSLFLDMVYLQQDAFDQVDSSAPLPRQKRTFDLVFDLVYRPYQFKDKSAIRDYFVRLIGLFKNLNYSQEETSQYKEFLGKIQELAGSTANQIAKS